MEACGASNVSASLVTFSTEVWVLVLAALAGLCILYLYKR